MQGSDLGAGPSASGQTAAESLAEEIEAVKKKIRDIEERLSKLPEDSERRNVLEPGLQTQLGGLQMQLGALRQREERLLQRQEAAAATQPPAAQPGGYQVVVKVKGAKGGKGSHKLAFDTKPSWEALVDKVDGLPDFVEADAVLLYDDVALDGTKWQEIVSGLSLRGEHAKTITLTAQSAVKAFSSFQDTDVRHVLGLSSDVYPVDEGSFPQASLHEATELPAEVRRCLKIKTVGEFLAATAAEVARRCLAFNPLCSMKEASKRELISPVLFAAALLAGDVSVNPEHSVSGVVASGSIDYALMYKDFAITVVEGKLHETLLEHLGQLAAEMRSARDQFRNKVLGKRKRSDDEDVRRFKAQVPSYGLLTNGRVYHFFKYVASKPALCRSMPMAVNLQAGVTADEALEAVVPIIRRLVLILTQQKQSLDQFLSGTDL